ncbi:MAG TPA: CDP-alcohol phosphatidyltransferase family protein [Stellaceae bacterium]|jgi:cardiolipin synthase|nr:CDP-alcohol phosphatidyltransferase family protein [Stellaceae bacterium]
MNLPNLISLGRLLSVPVAIWLVLSGELAGAFWLFVASGVSDAVDGFIAKRFDQRTRLGALLDPLADKALLVSVYVTLGIGGYLPNWLVILVVFRDVLIVGGWLLVAGLGQRMRWEPLYVSKLNTALQIGLIAVVLARLGLGLRDFGLVVVLTYGVGATTVISGAGYLVRWAGALAGVETDT